LKLAQSAIRALSINAAASYTGYSRDTILYWIDQCGLPYEEPPTKGSKNRFRRIRRADLDAFLDRYYSNRRGIEPANRTARPLLKLRPRESVALEPGRDYTSKCGSHAAS